MFTETYDVHWVNVILEIYLNDLSRVVYRLCHIFYVIVSTDTSNQVFPVSYVNYISLERTAKNIRRNCKEICKRQWWRKFKVDRWNKTRSWYRNILSVEK